MILMLILTNIVYNCNNILYNTKPITITIGNLIHLLYNLFISPEYLIMIILYIVITSTG